MDCRKRTRSNALFPTASRGSMLKIKAGWLTLAQSFTKLPAKALPAVLPAIILTLFVLLASGTVCGQVSQSPQVTKVDQLIEQLAHVDFDQREEAERQLIEIGSPSVDSLISSLLNCTPDVCSRVKRILQAVAKECDEESLFKVLAALRIRFEVPPQRIKPLLDRWAIQRRNAVVARWREQGAIVEDPYEQMDPVIQINNIQNQILIQRAQQQRFQFEIVIEEADIVESTTNAEDSTKSSQPSRQAIVQSIAKRLQLVVNGSIEQNKKLVLSSKQGAAGFEKSLEMLQKQPVSVKIGEQWRGDYSDFDFAGPKLALPISSFEIQKKVIDDSLLSVLNKHPLGYLVINECSVASDVRQKLSSDVKTLVMEGSGDSVEMIELLSNDESSKLNRVRFVKSKFGKAQANALSKFQHLFTVDLVKDDLKEDAFEGLASLSKLRRVGIEQCKFPAEAYLKFKKERPGVGINFTATAFLGVSANDPRFPARAGDFGPRPVDKKEPNIKRRFKGSKRSQHRRWLCGRDGGGRRGCRTSRDGSWGRNFERG